jgi:hypothetical protein
LYGIEVREYVAVTLVELRGELDLFSLADLRETLNRVLSLSRPALVDLSGITFLDLHSARELVLRYQLHTDHTDSGGQQIGDEKRREPFESASRLVSTKNIRVPLPRPAER